MSYNTLYNHFKQKSGNSLLKSELSDYSIDELTEYFRKNPDIFNKITYNIRKDKLNQINKKDDE